MSSGPSQQQYKLFLTTEPSFHPCLSFFGSQFIWQSRSVVFFPMNFKIVRLGPITMLLLLQCGLCWICRLSLEYVDLDGTGSAGPWTWEEREHFSGVYDQMQTVRRALRSGGGHLDSSHYVWPCHSHWSLLDLRQEDGGGGSLPFLSLCGSSGAENELLPFLWFLPKT